MTETSKLLRLEQIDPVKTHLFERPLKQINDGDQDLPFFLTSMAYADIMTFLFQLNVAMFPQKTNNSPSEVTSFPLGEEYHYPDSVQQLQLMLKKLDRIIDEVPPDPGPRRFGNISFRRWYEKVDQQSKDLLNDALPRRVVDFPVDGPTTVLDELAPYLLGSFGSSQRLDYGTGHELSFLAFLGGIWKLGGFDTETSGVDAVNIERDIVIGVMQL